MTGFCLNLTLKAVQQTSDLPHDTQPTLLSLRIAKTALIAILSNYSFETQLNSGNLML